MDNISLYSDSMTANTRLNCAKQRAENLAILLQPGAKVLEMCVGPSLRRLEIEYAKYGITCFGNDIDPRWETYYPEGRWMIGDALNLDVSGFDAIIFAPPLSKGCSGRREDSLSLEQVNPSYRSFLYAYRGFRGVKAMVLPGRTLSLRHDRDELYKLLNDIPDYDLVPLRDKVVKYVDIYITAG
jgi:hypothetical protein